MINNVSNVQCQKKASNLSFKGVYFLPNVTYMSEDNKLKTEVAAKLINKYFPQTDVFLGADNENDLTVLVQKKNNLTYLLDPEVISNMEISPSELVSLINLSTSLGAVHNDIWGKKNPAAQEKIKGVDKMSPFNIFMELKDIVIHFNEKYEDPKN